MTSKRLVSIGQVIKEAVNEFLTDNCPHLAASVSFYLILCLFPLILAAASIFGFIVREPGAKADVIEAITDFLPVSGEFIQGTVSSVSKSWGAAGIIATIGLIWAGMAVFNALRKSLNAAWGVKQPRPFLTERLMEFLMMTGFGALMLISIGLTTAFKVFGEQFTEGSLLWHSAAIATSILVSFLAFLFLYKLVPNTKVYWRHAAVGALAAALLFELVKNFFALFVADFATYNIVYGAVSIIIALMIWAYVSAVIMLFCAKITSIYPRIRAALKAEELPDETIQEKLATLSPSAFMFVGNISSLTSNGVGALRRLMLGKG
ncbi:MAG TPA: YihY/virulence factor BrkB family protein [Dehalococcoidia bacterium]|nr:YihY/virulence factor BrkB family protein [Dehalococcoidia bacterium]